MTAVPFIDLKAQQARIATDLRRRIDGVLAHCQFILGPEVAELEVELARFCGAKHCVAVSSGTDAIQIAFTHQRRVTEQSTTPTIRASAACRLGIAA